MKLFEEQSYSDFQYREEHQKSKACSEVTSPLQTKNCVVDAGTNASDESGPGECASNILTPLPGVPKSREENDPSSAVHIDTTTQVAQDQQIAMQIFDENEPISTRCSLSETEVNELTCGNRLVDGTCLHALLCFMAVNSKTSAMVVSPIYMESFFHGRPEVQVDISPLTNLFQYPTHELWKVAIIPTMPYEGHWTMSIYRRGDNAIRHFDSYENNRNLKQDIINRIIYAVEQLLYSEGNTIPYLYVDEFTSKSKHINLQPISDITTCGFRAALVAECFLQDGGQTNNCFLSHFNIDTEKTRLLRMLNGLLDGELPVYEKRCVPTKGNGAESSRKTNSKGIKKKYFEEQSYSDFQYREEHQKSKACPGVTSPLPTKNCVVDAGTNASDESGPGECASNILTPLPGVPNTREKNHPSSTVDTNKEENDVDYGNDLSDIESSLSELSIDEEDNYQNGIGGVTPRKRRSMVDLSNIETPNKKANKSCNDITNSTDNEERKKLIIEHLEKEAESLKKKLAEALCTMNKYANDKSSSKPNKNPSTTKPNPNSGSSTRFQRKFISSEEQDGNYTTLEIDDEINPIEEASSSTSNNSSRTTNSNPNPAKGVSNILTPFGWEDSRDGEEAASDQPLTPRQKFGKAFKPEYDEEILPTHVYALIQPKKWKRASSVEEKAKAIFYIGITEIPKLRFIDHKGKKIEKDFGIIILFRNCDEPLFYEHALHTGRVRFSDEFLSNPGVATSRKCERTEKLKRMRENPLLVEQIGMQAYDILDNDPKIYYKSTIKEFAFEFKCWFSMEKNISLTDDSKRLRCFHENQYQEDSDVDYGNDLSDIESSLSELSIDEESDYEIGIGGVAPRKRRSMVDSRHIERPNKNVNRSYNDIRNSTDNEEPNTMRIIQLRREVESLNKRLADVLYTINKYTKEASSSTSNNSSRTTNSNPNPAKGVSNILTPFGWEDSRDGEEAASDQPLTPRQKFGKAFKPEYDEEIHPMYIYALVRPHEWEKASSVEEKAKAIFYIGLTGNATIRYYQHTRGKEDKGDFGMIILFPNCEEALFHEHALHTGRIRFSDQFQSIPGTGDKPERMEALTKMRQNPLLVEEIGMQAYDIIDSGPKVYDKSTITELAIELKCSECAYATTDPSSLNRHMRTHTGEKPFKCTECAYATATSSDLNKHMLTHTREKPFKCSECAYTTTTSSNLERHTRTHTGEKPYKCSECSQAYTTSSDLTRHMLTHTGEKPFKCPECSHTTTTSWALKIHTRTHTGEKPFKCSECSQAYTTSSDLTRHMRTHTGEKPFKCSKCEYAFRNSSDLNRHFIRKHK
ncbi:zinc-finger double domain-containing protein [Ditylenchus destructor]|uniref:Zinc-finger double domain-containing protein n=1 Tax=Ditylenchus destructor TaxID=166010 RepID=A0AAD4NGI1_9BILA|nr:zinc-finger double domain-containing protein [Ditylenchus destructor]